MKGLRYEIDEKGTGYYIINVDNGAKILYQYPPYIPYERSTIEESAQAHIDEMIKEETAIEQERVTIEDLQKQIAELKAINEEQDMLLMEMSTVMV